MAGQTSIGGDSPFLVETLASARHLGEILEDLEKLTLRLQPE